MQNPKAVSDLILVARLKDLAQRERVSQVEILRYLAEVDERRIVCGMGYSGMWDFCRRGLGFSESASTRRLTVARAAKEYPETLTMLEDGRLTLCTAADLVPLLSKENRQDLFARAAGRTRREVQALAVNPKVKSVERDVIRRIPVANSVVKAAPAGPGLFLTEETPSSRTSEMVREERAPVGIAETPKAESSGVAEVASPSAPEKILHRVSFTAEDRVVAKLERLQEILGGASLAEVCDRAADLLLDKVDRVRRVARREAKAKARAEQARLKPKAKAKSEDVQQKSKVETPTVTKAVRSSSKPEPRRPGVALGDRIMVEAGMRCAFVSKDGVRCREARYLTVDHVRPHALGGLSNDPENLRCYCKAHNLHAARQSFGVHVHRERQHENRLACW